MNPTTINAAQLAALRDIVAGRKGCRATTHRALERRGLVTDSDRWPYVQATTAGRDLIAG